MNDEKRFAPPGYGTMSPYLIVEGAARLFDFLVGTFGGEVDDRTLEEDGTVRHGAVRIGDSMVEFAEARPEWPAAVCSIHIYVPDIDAAYARAIALGAESIHEPADMAYAERSAGVRDPTGNSWYIATYTGPGSDG